MKPVKTIEQHLNELESKYLELLEKTVALHAKHLELQDKYVVAITKKEKQ